MRGQEACLCRDLRFVASVRVLLGEVVVEEGDVEEGSFIEGSLWWRVRDAAAVTGLLHFVFFACVPC